MLRETYEQMHRSNDWNSSKQRKTNTCLGIRLSNTRGILIGTMLIFSGGRMANIFMHENLDRPLSIEPINLTRSNEKIGLRTLNPSPPTTPSHTFCRRYRYYDTTPLFFRSSGSCAQWSSVSERYYSWLRPDNFPKTNCMNDWPNEKKKSACLFSKP